MDRSAAARLIRDTFESPFDKGRFINLTRNLVKRLDDSRTFVYQGNIIRDAYKPSIQTLERVGKYEDEDGNKMDVLIARLRKETSLERARTMQRNFIAWYLNGSRGGELKDAALVAFVSPESNDWRFSLVRMDYNITESLSGKVKVEKELTPARRYSFLVGENESSHTAQTQLLPILEDDERNPLLSDFEKAFSVEVVTREFFTEYRKLFDKVQEALTDLIGANPKVKADFDAKEVDIANFAKKLLGQIVFLYFLQKKGWFGVGRDADWGTGPKDFLRRLFEKKVVSYENFFNDILEPLFYEALAVERTDDFYSRFDCKVPFLNGGLFDPINNYDWVHTDILLPDRLFSNDEKTKEDIGTGILDVFDRYNFTVKEDEPLDKEVAVDPEMLGKVFENLLEVKDRKSKGTYYTPREIVHYMCQESLIHYLDTAVNTGEVPLVQEKPTNLKLFGAPAFQQQALKMPGNTGRVPREDIEAVIRMGELAIEHDARVESKGRETKDYSYRLPESIRWNAKLIDDKLAGVRACDPAVGSGAFLVGLMTEIVRARNTLATYLPDKAARAPYDFKRHAIQNCLYGVDIDPGAVEIAKLRLWLSLVVDEEDIKQIQPLPNLDYKIVCGNSLLKCEQDVLYWPLFEELEKLKTQYFGEASKSKKDESKKKISALLARIRQDSQDFNFTVDFSEIFPKKDVAERGFDIVIANPPYIRQEHIKEQKPELQKYFNCYDGGADIYVYFYERGKQIMKKNGVLTYISPNKYFRAGYGEKLRRFLGNNCQICQIIDFGDAPVFEAIAYPSIIVFQNAPPQGNETKVLSWKPGPPLAEFSTIVRSGSSILPQNDLTADGWRLESSRVLRLLEKLRETGKPLGEYVNGRFYRGITTGLNEAFVVDRATRDRLIAEDQISSEILKPFLRGRDVKRWRVHFAEQYLLFVPWHFPLHNDDSICGASERAESEFRQRYPAIYRHLVQFKTRLAARNKEETGIRYEWYALQRCAATYWKEFEQPKIILGRFMNSSTFAFDSNGLFHNDALYMIPGATEYVMAILNSSTCWWFLSQICTDLQNGYLQAFRENLFTIPIPEANSNQKLRITGHVSKIIAARTSIPAAVTELERQIDQMVYELYGLTPEEIAVVEGKA